MFHATNFTESTEAFETLERLMRTAAAMQEYLRQNETSNINMTIVNFAQDVQPSNPVERFSSDTSLAEAYARARAAGWKPKLRTDNVGNKIPS